MHQVGENGFHCQYVPFSSRFSSPSPVRVFVTVNHGHSSSIVHDFAFIWVEDVTTTHFRACLVQGGQNYRGNTTIDWFAFQGHQVGVFHGEAGFDPFTTEKKCNLVTFPRVKYNIRYWNSKLKDWGKSIGTENISLCDRTRLKHCRSSCISGCKLANEFRTVCGIWFNFTIKHRAY